MLKTGDKVIVECEDSFTKHRYKCMELSKVFMENTSNYTLLKYMMEINLLNGHQYIEKV